ncbi:MAG: hypothetical protein KAX39_04795 [candidate division Zixibacteria bacterium]|nr:hypothetical protein [candidate division Zixibacteria bacterium]
MSLLEEYEKLLSEYDNVLNLSKMILAELKKEGKKNNLISLLEKKKMAGETIARLSEEIGSTQIKSFSGSNLKTLTGVRSLLRQITEKAKLLQEIEEKIQNFLQQKESR